jgi:uncharacterized C2H2 Zn-finger protein
LWLGCPDCDLAFSSEQEYKHHFGIEHPKRKFRHAEPVRPESENSTKQYRYIQTSGQQRGGKVIARVGAGGCRCCCVVFLSFTEPKVEQIKKR